MQVLPTRPSLNTSVLKWKRVSGISAGQFMVFKGALPGRNVEDCSTVIGRVIDHFSNTLSAKSGAGEQSRTDISWVRPEWKQARTTGGILCKRWLAGFRRLSSVTGSISRTAVMVGATLALLLLNASAALAQPKRSRRRSQPAASRSQFGQLSRDDGSQPAADRPALLRLRVGVWAGDLHAAQERSRPPLDARNLRADLRNLQNLSDHAGQIHPGAVGVYRRHYYCVLRMARAGAGKTDCRHAADHSALQPGRNCGQLWRCVVRHPRQHVCEFADGVRRTCAASRIRSMPFRSRRE